MSTRYTRIYGDQIDESLIGLGLLFNTVDEATFKIDVDVDDSSIEVASGNKVQVKASGITTEKIADDAVDKTKIAEDVAGLGLVQAVAGELDVNVDDSTLGISSGNVLEVKDGGITESKLDVYNSPTEGQVLKFTENGMEWAEDTAGVSASSFVFHEIPTGDINSTNKVYTIAEDPLAGTVQVFLNGLLQAPGGLDYTVSGTTITFEKAPRTSSILYVHYIKE